MKATMKENYGVEHALQSPDIQARFTATSRERWGADHPMNNPEVKDRLTAAIQGKYGVDNPFQSEEVKSKIRVKLMTKFGVDNPRKVPELVKKAGETCTRKYGVDHFMRQPHIKEACRTNRSRLLKGIKARFGTDSPYSSPDVRKASNKTIIVNHGGAALSDVDPTSLPHWTKVGSVFRTISRRNRARKVFVSEGVQIPLQGYEAKVLSELVFRHGMDLRDFEFDSIPEIPYFDPSRGIWRVYHPDFWIPRLNWVIEVKSDWTFSRDKETNLAKYHAAVGLGYTMNFIVR
jgi:hypothetical protein